MKFNWKLSDVENRRLRRSGWRHAKRTEYSGLSTEARHWLKAFNERLVILEDQFALIVKARQGELGRRIADPADWMADSRYELLVTFYLNESDPEYEKEDDNILMTILVRGNHAAETEDDCGFGNTHVNHAVFSKNDNDQRRCHLYHQLHERCYLDWPELLRIGSVMVDLKIREQSARISLTPFEGDERYKQFGKTNSASGRLS